MKKNEILEDFFSKGIKKNTKTGKEFGIEWKKDTLTKNHVSPQLFGYIDGVYSSKIRSINAILLKNTFFIQHRDNQWVVVKSLE